MIGLYPLATQPTYLLVAPWFDDIKMSVGDNKWLHIKTKSSGNSKTLGQHDYYVQNVKINGKPWNKNWFDHKDVMVNGGTIEFALGSAPKVWETGSVPPSPGHYTL